jgi:hypothetical protein
MAATRYHLAREVEEGRIDGLVFVADGFKAKGV